MGNTLSEVIELRAKLHPDKFPLNGKQAALWGWLLNTEWTEPKIVECRITADHFLEARNEGDCGCNEFFGDVEAIKQTLIEMATKAGVSEKALTWLKKRIEMGIEVRL